MYQERERERFRDSRSEILGLEFNYNYDISPFWRAFRIFDRRRRRLWHGIAYTFFVSRKSVELLPFVDIACLAPQFHPSKRLNN